jgi:MurNAc alpha-1-phosphate uridylyltransferase
MIRTAMILAAGRGERMRPLTDITPKPLAIAGGKPLIAHTLERLAEAGIERVVINLAWRGGQIREYCGDGSRWGVRILYSDEGSQALETGGGIVNALPLLGAEPFWVVSGDLWMQYPFAARSTQLAATDLAHLVMVPNPEFHLRGDFYLNEGRVNDTPLGERLTYASIALLRPELFAGCAQGVFSMVPRLRDAMSSDSVSGEKFDGPWDNVGTLVQLEALDRRLCEMQGKTSVVGAQ